MQFTSDTHCQNGHPFDEVNTYVRPDGERNFRQCRRDGKARRLERDGQRIRAWNRWYDMIQRCTNPKHPRWEWYGQRGITVCAEWLASFDAYYAYVGEPPFATASLDRINNNLLVDSYSPGNVRWATKREQALNRNVDLAKHNQARKTHCPQGHPYEGANLYIAPKTGDRQCRTCRAATNQSRKRPHESLREAA